MFISPSAREALGAIEDAVAAITLEHETKQKLWMPSELIPAGHTFPTLSPEITGMLVLNLLTEDGLPYFLGTLVKHLGDKGALWNWIRLWTAEEDRHGTAIKHYLTQSLTREQMVEVERLQYHYLRTGFWPEWQNDPFRLFAYVVLQERATQMSHAGIGRKAKDVDPVLRLMLSFIAGEEAKHHEAYFKMFSALMVVDRSHAVCALRDVIEDFAMPGENVAGFRDLTTLQRRLNAFGPLQFADIINHVWQRLDLAALNGLSDKADAAREAIYDRYNRLLKVGERLANRKPEEVRLPFLGSEVIVSV